MEGWHYVLIATAATVIPALGLSLLCRTEVERDNERRQPRWVKAKAAAAVAMGGAAAVVDVRKRARRQAPELDK